MKRLLTTICFLGICILGLCASSAAPYSFSLQQPLQATVSINASVRLNLRTLADTQQLELRFLGQRQLVPLEALGWEVPRGKLLIADFDFDGNNDLGVPTDQGYGGVNYFYTVYRFDARRVRFVPLAFPGDSTPSLCNPVVNAPRRRIETDCKSGPRWFGQDFQFQRGKAYVSLNAEMIVLNGFPDDTAILYATSSLNANGQVIARALRDSPRDLLPAMRYLPMARAYLYTAPRESARTNRYLVRGDAIRLLATTNDMESPQWLKIAYQSRKLGHIVRWIRLPD